MGHLLRTLLDLGHGTSQNLDFAYRNEAISFGEETITETNLLEIRRRHPAQVWIRTFAKAEESADTGADWEWHIVGQRHTLKMRIQAKRVTKKGSIRELSKRAPTSPMSQIDLLMRDASKHSMKAAYCFYSGEAQRSIWKAAEVTGDGTAFEAGCLLADAQVVKRIMPTRLTEIEGDSVPWHYLWSRRLYALSTGPYILRFADQHDYRTIDQISTGAVSPDVADSARRFPTVAELNETLADGTDASGISESPDGDLGIYRDWDAARARGVRLLMVVDVRGLDLMLRHFEPPPGERG